MTNPPRPILKLREACASCGSNKTSSRLASENYPYLHKGKLEHLDVGVKVYSCEDCGFEFTNHLAETARENAVSEFLLRESLPIIR